MFIKMPNKNITYIAKSMKQKKMNNYITFTCTDNGNKVIAITKPDYIHKIITFIETGEFNFKYQKNSNR